MGYETLSDEDKIRVAVDAVAGGSNRPEELRDFLKEEQLLHLIEIDKDTPHEQNRTTCRF